MTQRTRTIHLILFLAALVGLNYGVTGAMKVPTGNASLWLHAGLLMLILGVYWIEHFFTKPSDVVINGLIVFISISTLENPPFPEWWNSLWYFSLGLVILAFLIVSYGSPAIPHHDTSPSKRVIYQIVIRLGSAKVLFSTVFLLALLSYFDLRDIKTQWMVVFWGAILIAKHLEIESLVDFLIGLRGKTASPAIGMLSGIVAPNIVRFNVFEGESCQKGSLVAFTEKGIVDALSPIGLIIGYRNAPATVEAEAIIIDSNFREGALDRRRLATKVDTDSEVVKTRVKENYLFDKLNHFIAFATRGSDISRLNFELTTRPKIEEGHLLSVSTQNEQELLFQVLNGKLNRESTLEGSERNFTIGEAEQLGTWVPERQGFETFGWVVPENSPVFHVSHNTTVQIIIKEKLLEIGRVPNSSFPVNINIHDLVLYHSAILGVTGSGKSFLAYHLIEKCASQGIKVLCLDVTGDYKRYLRGTVLVSKEEGVKEFLRSGTFKIGIVEFSEGGIHPIQEANILARNALGWSRVNRTTDELKDPVPKVLLVFEEAHSLIPEWNSNPQRNLQDVVNGTAQLALQARKFGLGFMVITQRTANVTKSILNQCNTIFAFQAYDETGFDFMKNYMGDHYVQALPNLKKRQGVLVGKASVSDRPIIVRFHDQDREPSKDAPPKLPASEPKAEAASALKGGKALT